MVKDGTPQVTMGTIVEGDPVHMQIPTALGNMAGVDALVPETIRVSTITSSDSEDAFAVILTLKLPESRWSDRSSVCFVHASSSSRLPYQSYALIHLVPPSSKTPTPRYSPPSRSSSTYL